MTTDTEALPPLPERAAFEQWMSNEGKWPAAVERSSFNAGCYKLGVTENAWTAWQAAWSAALAQRQQVPDSEAQMASPQDGFEFWLWKNGDHFLAFRHLYPCFTPGGDPMVLGEPVGRAVFRRSFDRHCGGQGNAAAPALTAAPSAQAQPQEQPSKSQVKRIATQMGWTPPAGEQAQPQEPPRSAPLAEDPHREHWVAIAKAAEAIGASPNCGPEQAAEFCRAIDRLSAALMGEEDK